jgi:uncharacterized protein involved in type VI secretion and phage assembly
MSKMQGVIPGKVVSEPDAMGRVRVEIELLGSNTESFDAPIATPMAGGKRGMWFMPEKGDDVLIAFEQGNAEQAYVIGFLWNGDDVAPSTNRRDRILRSVNGHQITLSDPEVSSGDTGGIIIKDAHGNVIEMSNAALSIRSVGTLIIQAPNVIINGRPVAPAPRPI